MAEKTYENFETFDQKPNGETEDQAMEGQETTVETEAGGDQADQDDDDRKLFVGGLSWETTQKDLREYFEKFGEVTSCTLKTDLETRRSRGFGFVVFGTAAILDKVLEDKEHKLHGRTIDPKRANPRVREVNKKIFVGKVDHTTSEETIRAYFDTFGKIEKLELPFDKMKEQRRGFIFVEFEDEAACQKVFDQAKHTLAGQEVDIKKATPTGGPGGRGRGRGFGGGFGGGWVDRGGRGGRGGARGGRGGYNQGWNQGGGGYGNGNQGYNNYYNQGYGYGGYGGYGGYPGYDQNYYNQGGYNGWGGYDQGYGGYGQGYGGYDYSGWGGYDQQGQQQGSYGKTPKRGGGGYHPY